MTGQKVFKHIELFHRYLFGLERRATRRERKAEAREKRLRKVFEKRRLGSHRWAMCAVPRLDVWIWMSE
jgi:hypothetical protein